MMLVAISNVRQKMERRDRAMCSNVIICTLGRAYCIVHRITRPSIHPRVRRYVQFTGIVTKHYTYRNLGSESAREGSDFMFYTMVQGTCMVSKKHKVLLVGWCLMLVLVLVLVLGGGCVHLHVHTSVRVSLYRCARAHPNNTCAQAFCTETLVFLDLGLGVFAMKSGE
jgi:hypothetical protein